MRAVTTPHPAPLPSAPTPPVRRQPANLPPHGQVCATSETAPRAAVVRWGGWNFAGTIFLSAFLLFQVQPLVSKFILPYFALSATSPLVQVWFGRSCPGRSPYRLYALSNVGSLLALLSYPFFFEPTFDLGTQSTLWSVSFVLYAALCGTCLWHLWGGREQDAPEDGGRGVTEPEGAASSAAEHRPDSRAWLPRLLWVLLPACASLMLLATTNHVCENVAVVPFLWVVPLALYLLSFIICFDHARWYVRGVWALLAVLGMVAVAGNDAFYWFGYSLSYVQELVLYFSAMFCACMVCNGELVRRKPEPRRLTEFYLLIAAGGALGGVFVSLVAPVLFSTHFEWQIGVVACYVLAAAALTLTGRPGKLRFTRNLAIVPAAVLGLATIVYWESGETVPLDRARNFYGIVSVREYEADNPAEHRFIMKHGHITHGEQFADPQKRRWPTYCFGEQSGVGQAVRYFNERSGVRIGVVGLGVGTLAAYGRSGDQYRFYEINPEVLRLARKHFTYLDDCPAEWEVVLGDGRLSLERESSQEFHLLVLDAFSGDAPPAHLLTREAFAVYQRHLRDDGVIAVNITNTYVYLAPVVRGLAEHYGLKTIRVYTEGDTENGLYHADWMLLTRNENCLRRIRPAPPPATADDFTVPLWTDHFSNLFQILHGEEE